MTTPVNPKIPYGAILGRVIGHHRDLRHITQETLASVLGISQSAYSRLEKGHSGMTVAQLNAIAPHLGMTAGQLLQATEGYAAHLRAGGTEITDQKPEASAAPALLIALGILAALIAAQS